MNTATQERLTEQRYVERRQKLERALRSAKADHEKAALQFELGQLGEAELQAAGTAVSTIKLRQIGLEAAWAEAQRIEKLEQVERHAAERRAAAQALKQLDAKRSKEMKAIERIVASLAPHVQALNEISSEAVAVVRPHARLLADDPQIAQQVLSEFGRDVRDRDWERAWFLGALYRANFGGWGIGMQFPGPNGDLGNLNDMKAKTLSRIIRRLVGEDD